jgi:hypothetical protein
MWPIALGVLIAACLATRALADVPASPPAQDQTPPLSVWRLSEDGDAVHLQSGLACPAVFRGYKRSDLHFYDGFGLDVSCNYAAPGVDLTVYVTRRSGTADVDAAMAEARREFLEAHSDLHPQLISDAKTPDGAVAWRVALYGDDVGRDGIWIADLHGWTLEYRITYRLDVAGQAPADIAAMTQLVARSAGAHLDLCAKSPPPARPGVAIRDAKAGSNTALMSAIVGASASAAADGKAEAAPKPVTWCVEQPVHGKADLLFWRGVYDDGADAEIDRLTVMTRERPRELVVASDPTSALIQTELGRPPSWAASLAEADQTQFYGYFTGRPSAEALSALFQDILAGTAHPLSAYSAKSRSITIDVPSAK